MAGILLLPQSVNSLRPSYTNMHQWTRSTLVKIMNGWLISEKLLSKPMLTSHHSHPKKQIPTKNIFKSNQFSLIKLHLNLYLVILLPVWQGGYELINWFSLLIFVSQSSCWSVAGVPVHFIGQPSLEFPQGVTGNGSVQTHYGVCWGVMTMAVNSHAPYYLLCQSQTIETLMIWFLTYYWAK